VISHSWNCPI